ncbi:hypothetical protein AMTR_s00140p00061200 [Amborella trichopoda]|uniref:Uncharacterized protein n=1 Tax=Amborella trichopoda TaxID=13333 RepID=W1P4I5_AMBTC|nr:hypothetical protein AMTR_s00140p00061200 [Amborella trichopoda]
MIAELESLHWAYEEVTKAREVLTVEEGIPLTKHNVRAAAESECDVMRAELDKDLHKKQLYDALERIADIEHRLTLLSGYLEEA